MKELTERRKLQILRSFLEGYSYDDISNKSDVAKGTVVNVVNDFRAARFPAFTDVAELVDVLRELSVELRRRGGGVSEALLGNAFFFRLNEMGVTPDKLWLWEAMCREMSPSEEHLQEFTVAALELFRLSQETGESYNSIAVKWSELHTESASLEQGMEGLKSAKEELETTQANLTKDIQRLMEEKGALDRAVAELSTRHEALKTESIDIETRCRVVKTEIEQLQAKSTILGPMVERLDALGFGESELETLRVRLEELALNQGLTPEELRMKFFQDFPNYGAVLSFQKKKEELEAEVARLEAQKEALHNMFSRLGPTEEIEEAVRNVISLKRKRISPLAVVSYYRVLSQSEMEPDELERAVLKLGGLNKAITSHTEVLIRLQEEESKHTKVVEALRAEEAGIKATIRELGEWGQRAIREATQEAMKMVKSTMQEVKGEIRSVQARALEVGKKVGKMEKVLPSEGEVEGFFEFVSTPHHLAKNHPALFTVVNSLLNWVRSHEHELSYTERDRIRWGLEGLIKEITRKG